MAVMQIDGHRQVKALTITNAEIATAAAIALSKLEEAVLQADGGQTWTGDQNAGSHLITNLTDPVSAQDAATRAWVLAQVAGIGTSGHTVRAATTANITLSGTQTVDGVALSVGDRVLVKAQTTGANNGIYLVAAGAWTRALDMDTWAEVPGAFISVEEGTANGDTLWLSTADLGGTLNTTAVTFTQLPSPTDILAGNGLVRTGQTIDVVAGDASIVANANEIHVGVSGTGAITGAGALAVAVDNSTIEIASNALRVKDGGITAAKLAQTYIQQSHFIVSEVPGGSINGSNTAFTLANAPVAGTERLYLNGLRQRSGAGNDYTISGANLTWLSAPLTGDVLLADYIY